MQEKTLIPLSRINLEESPQLRVDTISEDKIEEWAELLRELDAESGNGGEQKHPFPPVKSFKSSSSGATHCIGDGHHRVEAYRRAGRTAIPAEVTVCDDPQFESWKLALSANSTNGIARSRKDAQRAVREAIACPKFQGMSDRAIGKLCGVNDKTVGNIRRRDAEEAERQRQAELAPASSTGSLRASTFQLAAGQSVPGQETETPRDKLGREVKPSLLAHWSFGQVLRDLRRRLGVIKAEASGFISPEGVLRAGAEHLHIQTVLFGLDAAMDELGNAAYHTECPECDLGKVKGTKCKTCSGAGFLTASMYERLPPKSKEKLAS